MQQGHRVFGAELEAHAAFLRKLKDPLWLKPPFAEAEQGGT